MALIYEDAAAHAALAPHAIAALVEARARFDASWLRPEVTRVGNGPTSTLAGYCIVEADSIAAAAAQLAALPRLPTDVVEVRPLLAHVPIRADVTGKVFACAVTADATDEAAWIAAMDRIADESRGGFPPDAFLGGARLAARAIDGPFLEAREVIGGLFLLRMASLADAVAWAETSAYVRHGALELREQWRI